MPAKRLRQEETTGATREEIQEAMNFGVRKRRSRKVRLCCLLWVFGVS